jgi:transposase-like protein
VAKKKIWRIIEDMLIKGVKEIMLIVAAIPNQCKFCGSKKIVRYGHYRQVQRWWCKDCKRKFVRNEALPRMRIPIIQVASALSMYYEGMSLHGIRRNLIQTYKSYPSNSTIYQWVVHFTRIAVKAAEAYKPDVGDIWVADETMLKIEGENLWFWDIIDQKTRFLLASHISTSRTTRDAKALVERAAERAGKPPKVIITDKLAAYLDGIELAFGGDTKHLPAKKLTAKDGTQIIERFHGTLKARTKIMRGLKTRKSAGLITDGYLVHYNFFRPHEALKDKSGEHTPAEKAGIKFPFKNWLDIVKGAK